MSPNPSLLENEQRYSDTGKQSEADEEDETREVQVWSTYMIRTYVHINE